MPLKTRWAGSFEPAQRFYLQTLLSHYGAMSNRM